jgi:succinate-semialdehyde dehydrogenase / glutarate-semialdehyde dehydrogenase
MTGEAVLLGPRLEIGAAGIQGQRYDGIAGAVGRLKALGPSRELGSEGLMAFREPKHIRMRLRANGRR